MFSSDFNYHLLANQQQFQVAVGAYFESLENDDVEVLEENRPDIEVLGSSGPLASSDSDDEVKVLDQHQRKEAKMSGKKK